MSAMHLTFPKSALIQQKVDHYQMDLKALRTFSLEALKCRSRLSDLLLYAVYSDGVCSLYLFGKWFPPSYQDSIS